MNPNSFGKPLQCPNQWSQKWRNDHPVRYVWRASGESAISPVTQKSDHKVIRIGRGWLWYASKACERTLNSSPPLCKYIYAFMDWRLPFMMSTLWKRQANTQAGLSFLRCGIIDWLMRDWQIYARGAESISRPHSNGQVSIEFLGPAHVAIITCNLEVWAWAVQRRVGLSADSQHVALQVCWTSSGFHISVLELEFWKLSRVNYVSISC